MNMTTETGLAARLRRDTRSEHARAERSGVMADLLRGQLGLGAYCALLRNLHAIYAALEAGLDKHPPEARLWRPELRRLPAIERDLDRLHTGEWRSAPLARAAMGYVERLTQAGPMQVLPHAYLRYLGDLHGGQVLARLVRQRFGLAGAEGTAFYAFGEPERVEALKQEFRAGLDALDLTEPQADAFVAEACEAFRRHQQLFEELARACQRDGS
jgi:heme oxygenase (biliverdin-producing, ferredoxin)